MKMRKVASVLMMAGNIQGAAGSIFGRCVVPRKLVRSTPACGFRISEKLSAIPLLRSSLLPQRTLSPKLFHTASLSYLSASDDLAVGEPDKLYSLVEVECRGHDTAVLRSYLTFVSSAASHLNVSLEEILWPKKHIHRWTLLKSVHIHKHHRVQYEVRTHFLIMKFARLTGSTTDTFLEYIQRNLPEGVAMKVTKHELHRLPEHVKPSSEVIV